MNKSVVLKKLKHKFSSKTKKIKQYYDETYKTYSFLTEIANPKTLKPIKGFLREYQLNVWGFSKQWFKKFEELNISYFFISGSLLGAYRNQGFIPWDDDIDIEMMRKDYEVLLQYLRENCVEVDTREICYSLNNRSAVLKKHIEKYPNTNSFAIFPTHLQILNGNNMETLKTLDIHPCDYFRNDYSFDEHKKYMSYIKKRRTEIDNFHEIMIFLEQERKNNPNIVENSENIYYGLDNFDTFYIQTNDWYKKSDIFPLKQLFFEDEYISVPNNIEKFLEINYGKNYNDMPNQIPLANHIQYRVDTKVYDNSPRGVLLKKLSRKYFRNKYKFIKDKYRIIKARLEILRDIIDVPTLKPTKNKLLRNNQLATVKFAKEITDFLEQENFEYFITSGTLIGAVRHKGFVPWDDDFDIGLMRKDYERLKNLLSEKCVLVNSKEITFKQKNTCDVLDKTIKNNPDELVCYFAPKYIQLYRGKSFANCVSIDIFPHEYYRDDYTFEEYKKKVSRLTRELSSIEDYQSAMEFLNKESLIDENVVEKSSKIYYSFDSLGTYIVNHKKFMVHDKIFPRKKIEFEGYEFYAPNDPDAYITVQYENYMSLPSKIDICPTLAKRFKQ